MTASDGKSAAPKTKNLAWMQRNNPIGRMKEAENDKYLQLHPQPVAKHTESDGPETQGRMEMVDDLGQRTMARPD